MRGESPIALTAAPATAAASRPNRRLLSTAEKLEAIQRVNNGESKASVARDIDVPESTLRGWCKNEHKIRGLATPDSEAAHSPATSTSGYPSNNTYVHNSEDDEVVRPLKRQRTSDNDMTVYPASVSSDSTGYDPTTIHYYLNRLNDLKSAGVISASEEASMVQQLGLFENITTSTVSEQQQQQQQQPLSLVKNGFSSNKSHNKRASTSSAIAPTSHVDSVSKSSITRMSLPPAAEAPLTSLPLSPREDYSFDYSQLQQQPQMQQQLHGSSSSSQNTPYNSGEKIDPALLYWLDQSSKYNAAGAVNSEVNSALNAMLWQYYFAAAAAMNPANLPSSSANNSTPIVQQVQQQTTATAVAAESSEKKYTNTSQSSSRKSLNKSRAALIEERVYSINNNNESTQSNLNLHAVQDYSMIQQQQPTTRVKEDKEEEKNLSLEEALQHAKVLSEWVEKYNVPINSVSLVSSLREMISDLEKKVSPVSLSSSGARRKSSKKDTTP